MPLHRWDEIALEKVTEMVSRKVVRGEREMLTQVYLKKGALVPLHAHEEEQMTYVLQGALQFLVGGEDVRVEEGDTRVWIAVVAPDGQATQLDFPGVIGSGFSSLGDTAEWRFPAAGARAPQALIVRLNISENPERADVATSYLVIARLGPGKPCVTAKVAPGRTA